MNNNKKEKIIKICIALMISVAMLVISLGIYRPIYYANDDVMIRKILSGAFSGNISSKTVYFNQPLSLLLSGFYALFNNLLHLNISWFDIFQFGIYFVCFFLFVYRGLCIEKKGIRYLYFTFVFSFCFVFVIRQLLMPTYTVTSAVAGATGIFLMILSANKENAKEQCKEFLPVIVLLILCYLIRSNVFFMMLPIWGVAAIYLLFEDKAMGKLPKTFFGVLQKYIPSIAVFFTFIVLCMGIQKISYSNEEWKEYSRYNEIRTQLYDYTGISNDSEVVNTYKENGFSEESIRLYQSYNFLLSNQISLDDIEKMLQLQPALNTGIKDAVYTYLYRMLRQTTDYPYNAIVILMYVILLFLFVNEKKYYGIGMLVLLAVARSGLWIYLIYRGRYPERVTISLYLFEAAILLAIILKLIISQSKKEFEKENEVNSVGMIRNKFVQNKYRIMLYASTGLLLFYILISIPYEVKHLNEEYSMRKSTIANYDMVYYYMEQNSDSLFLLDVNTFAPCPEYVFSEKNDKTDNTLFLSGWMAESPLYKQKLENYGFENARDALLNGDKVYFIGKTFDCLPGIRDIDYKIFETISCGEDNVYVIKYEIK